jgi:hypothetical protein
MTITHSQQTQKFAKMTAACARSQEHAHRQLV